MAWGFNFIVERDVVSNLHDLYTFFVKSSYIEPFKHYKEGEVIDVYDGGIPGMMSIFPFDLDCDEMLDDYRFLREVERTFDKPVAFNVRARTVEWMHLVARILMDKKILFELDTGDGKFYTPEEAVTIGWKDIRRLCGDDFH